VTFVGRATELEQFQVFLHGNDNNPWVMIITGMECIGKSKLLQEMQKQQSEDTLYVSLDFAVDTLQADIFHFNILEKLAEAISNYSDAQRFAAFEAQLDQARQYMADLNMRSAQSNTQSLTAYHSTITHITMSSDAREYIDRGKSINVDILKTALRRQLRTFTQKRLVILLDNFEWLIEQKETQLAGQQSADHWLINTLLPELHDYLHPSQFFVIVTTRTRPYFEAIKKDDLYYIPLHMLNREEIQAYLEASNLPLTWLPTIYETTMGHGLSITLFHEVLKEQGEKILNVQEEVAQQMYLAQLFYEKAWNEFVNERILKRLAYPFNNLIRYGVIPDTFNLPLLRYLFPELWHDPGLQSAELQDSQIREVFEKLLLYPCVCQDTYSSQQDYFIHPLVRTILLKHLEKQEQERLSYYQRLVDDYRQKIR
jgi:AAA ATPase domain